MGLPVLIVGESGSGKSTSLRNFPADKIGVLNVAAKPLPFRSEIKCINGADYRTINTVLRKNTLKAYAIDDSQYLLAFELFNRSAETGYGKFTDLAKQFYDLLQTVIRHTSEDTIVYFLHHAENKNGHIKAKTIGKMLDEKLTVEGLCTIVLYCYAGEEFEHYFITQSDGTTTAKSPMGMFELKIDNDLYFVDKTIREYYGFETDSKEDSNND